MDSRNLLLSLCTGYSLVCGILCYTACPKGWMSNEGSCYLFGTQAVHFTEAEAFCRKNGAHLVEVRDAHENTFIKDRLRDFKSKNWWMGLTDEEAEGEWKWFHSDVITSFTDWYPGQPENKDEDCAIFGKDPYFKWLDASCLHAAAPICEISRTRCLIGGAVTGTSGQGVTVSAG